MTCASVSSNPMGSSQVACHLTLQYTEAHKSNLHLTNIKCELLPLKFHRLTNVSADERNFHIFYHLLAGATAEEKIKFKLTSNAETATSFGFAYLDRPKLNSGLITSEPFGRRRPSNNFNNQTLNNNIPNLTRDHMNTIRMVLKELGMNYGAQQEMIGILAAILHLGNIEFDENNTKPSSSKLMPGHDASGGQAYVKNKNLLEFIATDLLGLLDSHDLNQALIMRTVTIRNEVSSMLINVFEASKRRNEFVKLLYELILSWIISLFNTKLRCGCDCQSKDNQIEHVKVHLLDLYGHEVGQENELVISPNYFVNYADEYLQQWYFDICFSQPMENARRQGLSVPLITQGIVFELLSPAPCLSLLQDRPYGINLILESAIKSQNELASDIDITHTIKETHSKNSLFWTPDRVSSSGSFGIRHYHRSVAYDVADLLSFNFYDSSLATDFITLFRGKSVNMARTSPATHNMFIFKVFLSETIVTQLHPRDENTIMEARPKYWVIHEKSSDNVNDSNELRSSAAIGSKALHGQSASSSTSNNQAIFNTIIKTHMDDFTTLIQDQNSRSYFINHIRPTLIAGDKTYRFVNDSVKKQLQMLGIVELCNIKQQIGNLSNKMEFITFLTKYATVKLDNVENPNLIDPDYIVEIGNNASSLCRQFLAANHWTTPEQYFIGKTQILFNEKICDRLEISLQKIVASQKVDRSNLNHKSSLMKTNHKVNQILEEGDVTNSSMMALSTINRSLSTKKTGSIMQMQSLNDLHPGTTSMSNSTANLLDGNKKDTNISKSAKLSTNTEIIPSHVSRIRKVWLTTVWMTTWWMPSFLLRWSGMNDKRVQLAWREKYTLCFGILLMSFVMAAWLIGLRFLLCPSVNYYLPSNIKSVAQSRGQTWIYRYGTIYQVDATAGVSTTDQQRMNVFIGQDVSVFPRTQVLDFQTKCPSIPGSQVNYNPSLLYKNVPSGSIASNDPNDILLFKSLLWYPSSRIRGNVSYLPYMISGNNINPTAAWIAIDNVVYNMTEYYMYSVPFLSTQADLYIQQNLGTVVSSNNQFLSGELTCMQQLYRIGDLTTSTSSTLSCVIGDQLLFWTLIFMLAIMFFKFVIAIRCWGDYIEESPEKFVILQVPCYTEGAESLKKQLIL